MLFLIYIHIYIIYVYSLLADISIIFLEAGEEVEADFADQTLLLSAPQEPQKPRRGHVGAIYEDIFKEQK